MEREIEDLAALVHVAGGSAYLVGSSSGAALALRVASALGAGRVTKLGLSAPPYASGDEGRCDFARYTAVMADLVAADRRGDAVAFFFVDMIPAEMIVEMRPSPEWALMEAVAPTLVYDNAVMGDGTLPLDEARTIGVPVLIVEAGESMDFVREANDAVADAIPQARRARLEGQTHMIPPEALASVLVPFFEG